MNKTYLKLLLFWLFPFVTYAEQMPVGYYSGAEGKKDAELKTALSLICRGGERVQYGPNTFHTTNPKDGSYKAGDLKAVGTWGAFALTDCKSDGSIYDMYGTARRFFPVRGQSAAGMEIEHCLPKSWWGTIENDAYKDLYHLNPADAIANTNKSNYPPGNVTVADKFDNGSFRMGKNSAYGDFFVFEPDDEYKGDFARAYFYVATAYEDLVWVDAANSYMDNSSYLEFRPWLAEVLLEWHRRDPVSIKEINRQEQISSIQHNRNPYIDYPELVEYIWGNKKGKELQLEQLSCTSSSDYDAKDDKFNCIALAATDVSSIGFVANFTETGAETYLLDVYHLYATGRYDTLLNVPLVKSDSLKVSQHLSWQKEDGSAATYSTTDGGGALYMSTTTEKRRFLISGLSIGKNAKLITKCSVYNKGDQSANLLVIADGDTIADQAVGLDEQYFTFSLPEACRQVILVQKEIGKKNAYHRVSMQQIFVVQGDYELKRESIEGYPCTVSGSAELVMTEWQQGEKLYYSVTPQGGRESNQVEVVWEQGGQTTPLYDHVLDAKITVTSTGEISSSTPFRLFDIYGHEYYTKQLPYHGVWIVATDECTDKFVW
mgnify:CR=1 FL=1